MAPGRLNIGVWTPEVKVGICPYSKQTAAEYGGVLCDSLTSGNKVRLFRWLWLGLTRTELAQIMLYSHDGGYDHQDQQRP